jgi:hypothetical protein
MNDIDQVRCERDGFKSSNAILRDENKRLAMLLEYAQQAIRSEYLLRVNNEAEQEHKS